jgi:dipeptidyl aminopeptidase/acylaminoacyl peptidase
MMNASPLRNETPAWMARFTASDVLWSEIAARNPERGVVVSKLSGVYQLYAWEVATGALSPLTNVPHGVIYGRIAPEGGYVYYHQDQGGNELGHWVRVPFEGGSSESVTPGMEPYASWTFSVAANGTVAGFTMAGSEGFVTYSVGHRGSAWASEPRRIYASSSLLLGPVLSADGSFAALMSAERSAQPQFAAVVVDPRTGDLVAELWDGSGTSIEIISFSPKEGDTRLLCASNRTGTERPLVWDAQSGRRRDLRVDELAGDVIPIAWSPDAQKVLLCQTHRAVHRLFIYDLAGDNLRRLDHPGGCYGFFGEVVAYFAQNGEIYAHRQDATRPLHIVALDGETGRIVRTVLSAGDVPDGRSWRSVSFASSDGEEIQGWLCVPASQGPFPAVLHMHGGPHSVALESFSPPCQAWVDQGFAYLTINYRGSITFGREFKERINGDLGHWEVEDMVAARQWLLDNGIASADKVFLSGRSYGGYLTLQALGCRPGLWAGGMAGVAVADWTVQYEDSAPTLRGFQVALLGGTPEEVPEVYRASSPITYVDEVDAPVIIEQGRNDTRCPARPVELYEARLRELGKPVEVHWFDSGHLGGFAEAEKGIDEQRRFMDFAERVLERS